MKKFVKFLSSLIILFSLVYAVGLDAQSADPEWLTNPKGVGDIVLPLFTPLSVNGTTISCWGRDIEYANSLFPVQIVNQQAATLNGPARLQMSVGGVGYTVAAGTTALTEVTNHTVTLSTSASAAGVAFSTNTEIAFDGQIKIWLTIAPQSGPVNVQALDFEVPLKQEFATLYHMNGYVWQSGLPGGGGLVGTGLERTFRSYFWLGDEVRGLNWIAESTRGYSLTNGANTAATVSAVRNGAETIMRVKFINKDTVIDAPRTILFALHPTPVKPLPEDWRLWRMGVRQAYAWWQAAYTRFADLTTMIPPGEVGWYYGVTVDQWLSDFRLNRPDLKVGLYWPVAVHSKYAPDFDTYFDDFVTVPYVDRASGEIDVCPRGIYKDFILHYMYILINTYDFDGWYFDMQPAGKCSNQNHGCGFVDDNGVLQPEEPIFAAREWRKRAANILYEKTGDVFIIEHMSAKLRINTHSFSTVLFDGEQFNAEWANPGYDYIGNIGLAWFRAEFMGKQWGLIPTFLPEMHDDDNENLDPLPTRNLMTLILLHDGLVTLAYCNRQVVEDIWEAKDLFGMHPTEFLPYWNNSSQIWVTSSSDVVKVSAYRKPDANKALIIVGNISEADRTVDLRFDVGELGIDGPSGITAFDAITYEDLPVSVYTPPVQGIEGLTILKKNFRMIVVEKVAPPIVTFIPPTPDDGASVAEGEVVEFAGTIDMASYDIANIGWDLSGSATLLDDSLILMYNLDENASLGETSTTVKDGGPGSNDGEIYGGASYVTGRYGKALSLDGLTGRIHVPIKEELKYRGQDWTISCWIRTHSGETGGDIMSRPWHGGGWYNYRLCLSEDRVSVHLTGGEGSTQQNFSLEDDSPITKEQWHHIAVTLEEATKNVKIYIDGELAEQGTHSITSWAPEWDYPTPLVIGSLYPQDPEWGGEAGWSYDGDVDEVRIFARVMDSAEIRKQYRCNLQRFSPTGFVFSSALLLSPGSYTYTLGARDAIYGELASVTRTLTVFAVGDGDGDGMPDAWETAHGLNPDDPSDAGLDPDSDGLTNLEEYQNNTDPNDSDTDDDGMPDGWEVQNDLNPLADDADEDPDGDTYSNLVEYLHGTDPHNPDDYPSDIFVGQDVALGYNLICIPLAGTGITDAEALAQAIPNCTAVWNWNALTQSWSGHPKGGPNNFSVYAGAAYLVSVTAPGSFECSGLWATPTFQLKAGYDLISLPKAKEYLTTAEELAQEVPNCTAIWKWDALSQSWVGHPLGGPNNFAVEVSRSYLITVIADGVWP